MKLYTGVRDSTPRCRVTVTEGDSIRELPHTARHGQAGFEWGYYGLASGGSADLAFAILADLAGNDVAEKLHDRFRSDVILQLPRTYWRLAETDIRRWLSQSASGKAAV